MIGPGEPRQRRVLRHLAVVAIAAYGAAGLFTLVVTAPMLPDDSAILIRAARRALAGQDPYLPAGIGAAFVYPPTALPLLAPLAFLPDRLAGSIWRILSASLFIWSLAVLASARRGTGLAMQASRRDARTVRPPERAAGDSGAPGAARPGSPGRHGALLLAAACLYAPPVEDLVAGQANAVVLLGLALFVTRGAPTCRWLADGGLAVAIAMKVTPALLLLAPAMRRESTVVARVIAAVLGLAAVSLAVFGTAPWPWYAAALHGLAAGDTSGSNLAPAALLVRAGVLDRATGRLGSAAIGGGVLAWCAYLACLRRQHLWRAITGMLVCGAVLASPVIWYHHLTWLAVPLAGTVEAGPRGRAWLLAVAALALIQADRPVEVFGGLPPVLAAAGAWLMLVATSIGLRDPEGVPPPRRSIIH